MNSFLRGSEVPSGSAPVAFDTGGQAASAGPAASAAAAAASKPAAPPMASSSAYHQSLQANVCYGPGEEDGTMVELHCPLMSSTTPGADPGSGTPDGSNSELGLLMPKGPDMEDIADIFSFKFCTPAQMTTSSSQDVFYGLNQFGMDTTQQQQQQYGSLALPMHDPHDPHDPHQLMPQFQQDQVFAPSPAPSTMRKPKVVKRGPSAAAAKRTRPSPPPSTNTYNSVAASVASSILDSMPLPTLHEAYAEDNMSNGDGRSRSNSNDDDIIYDEDGKPATAEGILKLQKKRNCEASARYRKRKQNELETLRQQYLELFAESKKLQKRMSTIEADNEKLRKRAEDAEAQLSRLSSR